ncbi:MAG: bifunctional glutamate N-acetyltransferase/amino-acid acetyltransferase ArgJ [bacterium]|nr:bifunctional glutamate N-acetyltransferase/amino-acid acetyltransferase ArgJ [bacterium]
MSIRLPQGYRFAGVACGLKASGKKDIALVVSDMPAVAAGVYTQNQVVAAPVLWCRERTPSSEIRAVVVNSGNANACTGSQGMADAQRMCELVAQAVNCSKEQVLVMSTGVIGRLLDMRKLESGIEHAAQQLESSSPKFLDAADGILTTDQGRKIVSRTLELGGKEIGLAGMAKGAGMIGPNMATMLCCILTDARLEADQAHRILTTVADLSFNNISVEGHTSTNDTMLLLANGAAAEAPLSGPDEAYFTEQLTELCIELAKQIPADGEGAKHLIEVRVVGASCNADARIIAKTVAGSNLVKTAIYGNDPNWGRIVSAAGYAGPFVDVTQLQLRLNGIALYDQGEPLPFDAKQASASLRDHDVAVVELVVGKGEGNCTHWTSDLTVEYVRFNSEYTT